MLKMIIKYTAVILCVGVLGAGCLRRNPTDVGGDPCPCTASGCTGGPCCPCEDDKCTCHEHGSTCSPHTCTH